MGEARAGQVDGGPLADLSRRLAGTPDAGGAAAFLQAVGHVHALVREARPTPEALRAAIDFLTEVGHSADARRQEWVLLADVIGVSTLVEDLARARPDGVTPNTLAGPFYRADAPDLPLGATISRDGRGAALSVGGTLSDRAGVALPGALVEVWQANGEGRYENQEPDQQPEFNLRGRFRADAAGHFHFLSVKPGGYFLPEDGPVGRLLNRFGCRLERPAHLHFRVTAAGYETLTTHVFDRADPAIGRDALFGVKPALLGDFVPDGRGGWRLAVNFRLAEAAESEAARRTA